MTPLGRAVSKRVLELAILVSASTFALVLLTGPARATIAGVTIEVTRSYPPFAMLVACAMIRLLLTVEVRTVLLMLGSLTFTLVLAEVGLRVLDPPIARPHLTQIHAPSPVFDWELVPGSGGLGSLGESYRVNSAGFRDTERPLARFAGIHRIMVIGDSFTFGMGVNLEDSYPKQLERILNGGGKASEVINCGVIGYNMWQHYEVLVRKVLPYRPDLVILGLFEDDLGASVPPYILRPNDPHPGHNPFAKSAGSGPLGRFAVWNVLTNANVLLKHKYRHLRGASYLEGIKARKLRWGPASPMDSNYRIMSGKMEQTKYAEFSTALKRFVVTARDAGARVLVVMIPDSVQLNDPALQFVNRFVRQAAAEIRVPFVDTTAVLEADEDPASLYLFPMDAHNSPKGLRLIAEAIADRILESGLLPSSVTTPMVGSAGRAGHTP